MLDIHLEVLWGRAASGSISFLSFCLGLLPLFCFSFYRAGNGDFLVSLGDVIVF